MKKFSNKRGSQKKKKKIKSFEKLFTFICFLDISSDGGNGCSDLLCYGAVFGGGWRFGGLRWIDTGSRSEFGLCYWCWICFCCFLVGFVVFFIDRLSRGGGGILGICLGLLLLLFLLLLLLLPQFLLLLVCIRKGKQVL